ncbi:MAG: hypothetical protein Q4G24_01770 [Paracoccus sp. (in: a-proteobacteria)]|nr:hypothetical protein [Paracoccus sp. (in: a-proteobacteria)]MDO5620180.1 hypothetical protein [Paracoccus sp. (in: a-proteobacteria)]
MTNSIAFALALLVIVLTVADMILTGGQNLIFLGKKVADLINWVAFWR